jgi:hypothetical protein
VLIVNVSDVHISIGIIKHQCLALEHTIYSGKREYLRETFILLQNIHSAKATIRGGMYNTIISIIGYSGQWRRNGHRVCECEQANHL